VCRLAARSLERKYSANRGWDPKRASRHWRLAFISAAIKSEPTRAMRISRAIRKVGPKKLGAGVLVAALAMLAVLPILRTRCIELRGAETLTISLAHLEGGDAHLFCYRDRAGERLRFLLARGNDGKVRAVFDACRQCYKFHQGYDVARGMLICRLCGNRYPIDHMTRGEASCVPVSLPHHDDASAVEVKVSDLKSGAALF
jgi:Membrane iron-sulfur containing protein FtrD-like